MSAHRSLFCRHYRCSRVLSRLSQVETELDWSKKLVIQVIQVPNNLQVSSTHPQENSLLTGGHSQASDQNKNDGGKAHGKVVKISSSQRIELAVA
jgi:hypothetical protein